MKANPKHIFFSVTKMFGMPWIVPISNPSCPTFQEVWISRWQKGDPTFQLDKGSWSAWPERYWGKPKFWYWMKLQLRWIWKRMIWSKPPFGKNLLIVLYWPLLIDWTPLWTVPKSWYWTRAKSGNLTPRIPCSRTKNLYFIAWPKMPVWSLLLKILLPCEYSKRFPPFW